MSPSHCIECGTPSEEGLFCSEECRDSRCSVSAKDTFLAARDAAEAAACQRLMPELTPELLACAAAAARAWGIDPTDPTAVGVCLDPERQLTGAAERAVLPAWERFQELLLEEQQARNLEALREEFLAEHAAEVAANQAHHSANPQQPIAAGDTDGMDAGFGSGGMHLH